MHIAQSWRKFSADITSIPQSKQKGRENSIDFLFFGRKEQLYEKVCDAIGRRKLQTKLLFVIANFLRR